MQYLVTPRQHRALLAALFQQQSLAATVIDDPGQVALVLVVFIGLQWWALLQQAVEKEQVNKADLRLVDTQSCAFIFS